MSNLTEKENRLEIFLKYEGTWEALYYNMTTEERELWFYRLIDRIKDFEND